MSTEKIRFFRRGQNAESVEYEIDLSKWPEKLSKIADELIGLVFTEHADESVFHNLPPGVTQYGIGIGVGDDINEVYISSERLSPESRLLISLFENVCRARDPNGNTCGLPLPCRTHRG